MQLKQQRKAARKKQVRAVGGTSLSEAAADLDVAGAMSNSVSADLDDFLDGGEEGVDRTYYTVYGLRRQADRSRSVILDDSDQPPQTTAEWLGQAAAEAVGIQRKEALNLSEVGRQPAAALVGWTRECFA